MSQAHERYSGSRDSGQRQTRHHVKKPPTNRQGQLYAKGAPSRDPAQTASIFKTRSFQLLVDAVGAENIALGLDSNLTRVAELMRGERFTPETAFHMETTLGLPHGFFDQPNPVLAPETIARLNSPLHFVRSDDELEALSETLKPTPPKLSQQPLPKDCLSEEPEMPKKATGGSPAGVKSSGSTKAVRLGAGRAPQKDTPAKAKPSPKESQPQPVALNGSSAVENIRRANLQVLTIRNGSKVRLGALMALTGSNMAHRLHGKKRMDDAEATRFTERLGLPIGWLDTPHSETDIPESVSRLLAPAPRGRTSAQQQQPPVAPTNEPTLPKSTGKKARAGHAQVAAMVDVKSPPIPADVSVEEAMVLSQQHHANRAPAELARRSLGESVPVSAPLEQPSPAVVPHQSSMLPSFSSPTSLDSLEGIEPIAEALIKTLAGKARTGRLDELKALELLQQAMLL
ncbi:hypothetical protein B0G84_7825 [Paraburkholderia sp. BL8N3]|nr:hypothetical protein [Paraburkholderia sp. BL8N3]TCK33558.1 hypothetical protein B0G84_7825 [Paraburkholderia sp. BL8N3]